MSFFSNLVYLAGWLLLLFADTQQTAQTGKALPVSDDPKNRLVMPLGAMFGPVRLGAL